MDSPLKNEFFNGKGVVIGEPNT